MDTIAQKIFELNCMRKIWYGFEYIWTLLYSLMWYCGVIPVAPQLIEKMWFCNRINPDDAREEMSLDTSITLTKPVIFFIFHLHQVFPPPFAGLVRMNGNSSRALEENVRPFDCRLWRPRLNLYNLYNTVSQPLCVTRINLTRNITYGSFFVEL